MNEKKYRKVTVTGENGEQFNFKFQMLFNVGENELVCETRCPYGSICQHIRDPRKISDKNRCFLDFCGELGESDDPENLNIIPTLGSIEEGYKDTLDIFQDLIKINPTIRVSSLIDKICASGWCADYSPDHRNCTSDNKSCLLNDLFIKIDNSDNEQ